MMALLPVFVRGAALVAVATCRKTHQQTRRMPTLLRFSAQFVPLVETVVKQRAMRQCRSFLTVHCRPLQNFFWGLCKGKKQNS